MSASRHVTTKILATMGPASESVHRARALVQAGVSAFRMNFSHGSHEEHAVRFNTVREVAKDLGRHVPIIADMQGPKLRCGRIAGGSMQLNFGDRVEAILGETAPEGVIPIPHEELFEALKADDVVMLDDGFLRLSVIEAGEKRIEFKVEVPGKLTDRKGINIPGRKLRIDALTEKDKADLAFALEQNTDYIALSFVQTAEDVHNARKLIGDRARIISKIEKPSALDELDAIVAASDGVMVARGDLGVELPLEMVPPAQRRIIRTARAQGKLCIVATQMLQSMIDSPTPTRAEASDTATAVYYGADAVMLSAESAVGRHPEAAVAIMARIIRAASSDPSYFEDMDLLDLDGDDHSVPQALATAASFAADVTKASAIVASTNSGSTAYTISQHRPIMPIVAVTPNDKTARQLGLAWGVEPILIDHQDDFESMSRTAVQTCRERMNLEADDHIVLLAGIPTGRTGGTNTLKIIRVGDAS
ncbi:pyruvate kinase [Parvularcula sp. LCG005]|uniref:pyruvate kinase n=1 Tax=Parvularcula sp. LCG005 TaxID=3078805 RepID=UPI002942B973|nr:pyruvate kinase [Parvularcula sp. LCG005]WOI52885.1 pyruvate kinase [Parvularcula sp. LCG005]